ncbi:MAG: hypothetical protein M1838_002466 [Thelocarpon superellum]|nr:MAG: hypothetical protein M1838_002466 [Thelocarpon superellum]
MPIFHEPTSNPDPDDSSPDQPRQPPGVDRSSAMRKPSDESIGGEAADRLDPDSDHERPLPKPATLTSLPDTSVPVSNRTELIERIKRGESPTWVPNRTREQLDEYYQKNDDPFVRRTPQPHCGSPLLPAAEIETSVPLSSPGKEESATLGAEIERPRSALHAGDFTHESHGDPPDHSPLELPPFDRSQLASDEPYAASPGTPWYSDRTPSTFPFQPAHPFATPAPRPSGTFARSRAPSRSSYASSFVYRTPTSPLVQSSNNNDVDLPSTTAMDVSGSPSKSSRRHTLPSQAFIGLESSDQTDAGRRPTLAIRREHSSPLQAHQPRRSLSSTMHDPHDHVPQTPMPHRSRRPSLSSDVSPLQHAPMVGSYEESILRGRMSTVPSKPLNFLAQIGVLGLGDCKPQLRCPAHVSVPFPAVFYSYGKVNVGRASGLEDGPSPYVGLIDLEHSLQMPTETREERRRWRMSTGEYPEADPVVGDAPTPARDHRSEYELRKREKRKRRSGSPKAPAGGSYRIPQKGQLQIVIKNPNKTAVKLFLVPYDLQGMEAGTKTFIRQRSYSAGPVIHPPLGARTGSSTERSSSVPGVKESQDRPTLRYLIHLHICCPARGRFFLYKSIRVVFANRVPDGKEQLRNEIQLPEPRYTTYKATRDPHAAPGAATDPTQARRRSSGHGWQASRYDAVDGIGGGGYESVFPVGDQPLFAFGRTPPPGSPSSSALAVPLSSTGTLAIRPPANPTLYRLSARGSPPPPLPPVATSWHGVAPLPAPALGDGGGGTIYSKLNRGDVGYGGKAFSMLAHASTGGIEGGVGADKDGEGLLARRLRGLDGLGPRATPGQGPSHGLDADPDLDMDGSAQ